MPRRVGREQEHRKNEGCRQQAIFAKRFEDERLDSDQQPGNDQPCSRKIEDQPPRRRNIAGLAQQSDN
jgi:hypothetical protein